MWTTEYTIKIVESKEDRFWKIFAIVFSIVAGIFLSILLASIL